VAARDSFDDIHGQVVTAWTRKNKPNRQSQAKCC
jgi:hypothetical protein